jgi:hypothetical protein
VSTLPDGATSIKKNLNKFKFPKKFLNKFAFVVFCCGGEEEDMRTNFISLPDAFATFSFIHDSKFWLFGCFGPKFGC